MDFKRARTPEQRELRRQQLFDATARMLDEMPVAALSLNELSRRVGLAKSNVLNYYESREAILLELLNKETRAWLSEFADAIPTTTGESFQARARSLVTAAVSTLEARPVLCDLLSSQAAVLERNVSTEVALQHKRSMQKSVRDIAELVTSRLPELTADDGEQFASAVILAVSAAWPYSLPTEALQAAYAADQEVAKAQVSFADMVGSALRLTLSGLHAEREATRTASDSPHTA